jgi:hypothetical protein
VNRLLVLFAALAALTCSAFAQLEEIEFDGSNQLRFDNGREVDGRRGGFEYPDNTIARRFVENKLRLDLFSGNYHLGGRYLYFRPSEADVDQFRLGEENRFDKRFFEATIHPFKVRFGHFSDLWGKGLALSLFENRDLYFDSELDGVRAQAEVGSFKLVGMRGTTADGLLVPETEVTAGRFQVSPGKGHLAFNYVYHDSSASKPEMSVASFDWNLSRGALTLYGERVWNEAILSGGNQPGHATFFGVNLSRWGWALLAEYADYNYRIVTPIQNPPTTYREVGPRLLQSREPHILNIPDEVGAQLELTGSITEATYLTLHYNASSHHSDEEQTIPLPEMRQKYRAYWEMFANVEHTFDANRTLLLEVGANEEASVVWQERMWGQARVTLPFRASQEIELETEQLLITDRTRDDEEFHDQLYGLGWIPSGRFSAFGALQLTDDEELKNREGDLWGSGEIAWQFGNGAHRAILFYGRERGGLKCSNGVCRQVQAFSGLRLTIETSF